MAALLELARLRIVEPAPSARRHHKGHVGVVQAAECACLLQTLEQTGRPRSGEAGDQQKPRVPLPTAFAPAPNLTVVEPTVQRQVVQGDAVQKLIEGRIRAVVRLPLREHKAQRAPDGQGHNARPTAKSGQDARVMLNLAPRPRQGHADHHHRKGQREQQQKRNEHLGRPVLQFLQRLVILTSLQQTVQQMDAVQGQSGQNRRPAAEQQKAQIARHQDEEPDHRVQGKAGRTRVQFGK